MRFAATLLCALLALAGVLQSDDAKAAVAGTGTFTMTINTTVPPPYPLTGTITWNNDPRTVFDRNIDLTGSMSFSGVFTPGTGSNSYSGTATLPANAPFNLSFDVLDGVSAGGSFVGRAVALTGDWVGPDTDDLPPDDSTFAYTGDGAADDCQTVPGAVICTGVTALNVFQSQPTPTGGGVTTTVSTSFFNPITGTEVPVVVELHFSGSVTQAGNTQVTTTSYSAGSIPSNFAIELGSWSAAFVDITTTAVWDNPPPWVIPCISYPDSDDDGFVDGMEELGSAYGECELRILHKSTGSDSFSDSTLPAVFMYDPPGPLPPFNVCPFSAPNVCPGSAARCIDRANNKVCALTLGLSPFVVVPRLPAPVPALSPRGVLVLGGAMALVGAALLAARRRAG